MPPGLVVVPRGIHSGGRMVGNVWISAMLPFSLAASGGLDVDLTHRSASAARTTAPDQPCPHVQTAADLYASAGACVVSLRTIRVGVMQRVSDRDFGRFLIRSFPTGAGHRAEITTAEVPGTERPVALRPTEPRPRCLAHRR